MTYIRTPVLRIYVRMYQELVHKYKKVLIDHELQILLLNTLCYVRTIQYKTLERKFKNYLLPDNQTALDKHTGTLDNNQYLGNEQQILIMINISINNDGASFS